jgi:hypothetical protein
LLSRLSEIDRSDECAAATSLQEAWICRLNGCRRRFPLGRYCRAEEIERRQTSKGLTPLPLHQPSDYLTILYYEILYWCRIVIAKKESNLKKKRTTPIMIFDNVEFNWNHTYVQCRHSDWRTRHPPRRVLNFASRLVAQMRSPLSLHQRR